VHVSPILRHTLFLEKIHAKLNPMAISLGVINFVAVMSSVYFFNAGLSKVRAEADRWFDRIGRKPNRD